MPVLLFWFLKERKPSKKRKTKNPCLVFTLNRCCVYPVRKNEKPCSREKNTNNLHLFLKQKHHCWCAEEADGRWAATPVGRSSATKRPLELCLRHHFDRACQCRGTHSNSLVWTEFLLSELMLIQEENAVWKTLPASENVEEKWQCCFSTT